MPERPGIACPYTSPVLDDKVTSCNRNGPSPSPSASPLGVENDLGDTKGLQHSRSSIGTQCSVRSKSGAEATVPLA